jgi:ribose transport system permease protein
MRSERRGWTLGVDRFSGVYVWIVFIVGFGIWSPHAFLTVSTLHSVASSQAIDALIAIAVMIPLAAGAFDLSVGANANLAGIVAVVVQVDWHWTVLPAVLLAVAVGAAVGLVNSFIVVKLGVSSFIATLGMGSILAAVQVIVTGNEQPSPVLTTGWNNFTQLQVGGFQIVVIYLLAISVVAWWFLEHTPAGRYLYATGANMDAARLSGVRVDRWTSASLVIGGSLAGLAGVLGTSLSGPSLTFGATLLLPAFAAAFLGSTQIHPGRFNVLGTILMIYVLATGVEGLQLVSGQQWLNDMFDGVALIVAVALAVNRQRSAAAKKAERADRAEDEGASGVLGPDTDSLSRRPNIPENDDGQSGPGGTRV